MVAPLSPVLALGIFLAEAGWFEPVAATIGAIALAVLAWRLSKTQAKTTADLTERTRQLAHEREKNIQTSLEKEHLTRENKAKSEMLATLSREIRGHLNGIMGSADLLVDHSLKPRQRENLATLRASAESLHQSLNDVIDYSSIETGQIKIAHAPFELRQPLTDVIETLSPLALLKALERARCGARTTASDPQERRPYPKSDRGGKGTALPRNRSTLVRRTSGSTIGLAR